MTLTARDVLRLEECLLGDGVAVLPTDTVYGLACNPASERAVARLYELKGRPPRKPSAVMFFALDAALDALPEPGPRTRAALAALLPGPVTLLLPNYERLFPLAFGAHPSTRPDGMRPAAQRPAGAAAPALGLRVPRLDGALAALSAVRVPALQSSANMSGDPDPRRLADVPQRLRDSADLVLDGGELPGAASTVIDLSEYERTGVWSVVRDGALPRDTLRQALV